MRNKIIKLLLLALVLVPSLYASESEEIPRWIDVSYSNLANDTVSEYQMVTVTITKWSPLFIKDDSNIEIEYDEEILSLRNTYLVDEFGNSEEVTGTNVSSTKPQYKAVYHFFLTEEADASSTTINVTKTSNGKKQSASVPIKCESLKQKRNVSFGNTTLSYSTEEYVSDGTTITLDIGFEVIETDGSPISISIKQNTMNVKSTDDYEIKLRFTDGDAKAIDKNNFKLSMKKGDKFNLHFTANIAGLDAKDDKFTFFIMISDGTNFTRIQPLFYRNYGIDLDVSKSEILFYKSKLLMIGVYVFLFATFIISSRRNKLIKRKSKKQVNKLDKEHSYPTKKIEIEEILENDSITNFDDFDKLK